jgi:uncharacterized protein (DUF2252 family)
MDGYDNALGPDEDKEWIAAPEPVIAVLKKAFQRRWRHLAEERIEDVKPRIPLGRRFWPLSEDEHREVRRLGQSESLRRLVTHLRSRKDEATVEPVDAAYWVKGCSSLGRLRYAVLLQVKGGGNGTELCLIDIKEAVHAAAPRAPDAPDRMLPETAPSGW